MSTRRNLVTITLEIIGRCRLRTNIKTISLLFVAALACFAALSSCAFAEDPNASQGWVGVDASNARDGENEERDKLTAERLKCDRRGVQHYFPAVAKIVGRSEMKLNEDGAQTVPFFYGTGSYVCEYGRWGIVVTNWHVVNEATDAIEVVFPSGRYLGRVILRDEKWDLAALLIRAPLGVDPIPVSEEGPAIGETFWVGGYGHSADLAEFQIGSGKLTNYVSLVDPDDEIAKELERLNDDEADESDPYRLREARSHVLTDKEAARLAQKNPSALYETLQISQGVRQGDSGGPIFNRYGELAGVLWGSDGKCTMGTSCIRLRAFLTQATWQTAKILAESRLDMDGYDGVIPRRALPWECAVAGRSSESAKTALEQEGVFPICSREIYRPVNAERADGFLRISESSAIRIARLNADEYQRKHGAELPPSPPIFSPTFVVLQRGLKCERPEALDERGFTDLDAYWEVQIRRERERKMVMEQPPMLAETEDSMELSFAAEARADQDALAFEQGAGSARPALTPVGSSSVRETGAELVEPNAEGFAALDEYDKANAESTEKAERENDSEAAGAENAEVEEAEERETAGPPERKMGPLSIYLFAIMLFLIFFFAMRYFEIGAEAQPKKKSEKARLHREK